MITKDELLKIKSDGREMMEKEFRSFFNDIEDMFDSRLKSHFETGSPEACIIRMDRIKYRYEQKCKNLKIRVDDGYYLENICEILSKYRDTGIECDIWSDDGRGYPFCLFDIW